MPSFQYKARDKSGSLMQGVMGADTDEAVAAKLEKMGYLPVLIEEVKTGSFMDTLTSSFRKIKFTDLNMMIRQLYTLQKAGLPLLASLKSVNMQMDNKDLKDVISQVSRDIEAGSTLSAAMERHPHVFNELYVNMVRSGEISGRLPEVLERLATLGEHDEKIRKRIKAAMRYPLIVVIAISLAFTILITMVVPRFAKLYAKFTTELPIPTKILLFIHAAITHYWWAVILGGGITYFGFLHFINTPPGRLWWDDVQLRIPVLGPLTKKMTLSRFCRITGTLMRSGVPILQILELVSRSMGNVIIARTINKIKVSVNEGKGMHEPMVKSGMFPPVVTQMVAVGEDTGQLDELLIHVSEYFDQEVDYTLSNMVSLIEPMLILVLGVAVMFMALGIFMPMWSMMHLFKTH